MHIANDFIYGASKDIGKGFKINALPSNTSVLTCLANDEGYEEIVAYLKPKAEGDVRYELARPPRRMPCSRHLADTLTPRPASQFQQGIPGSPPERLGMAS